MKTGISLAAIALLGGVSLAHADNQMSHYQVTVTNITKGMNLTPFLASVHKPSIHFFELGTPATDDIANIAERGNIAPLKAVLDTSPAVYSTATTEGLLAPGASVTFDITGSKHSFRFPLFSLAAMMVPTNDTFVSLNGVRLPLVGSVTYLADAYDAGSEPNDELCIHVPGPTCGGEGYSPDVDGEGYIYPSPATHGEGDLSIATYRWDGPVAKVTITRMY